MNDRIDDLVAAHRDDIHPAPAHLKQQWHDAIDSAAAMERGKTQSPASAWHPASVFLGMAIAAALALGIGIGYFMADEGSSDYAPDVQVADVPAHSGVLPASLSRGVQVHFRDSREQLLSLPDPAERTLLVRQIIEQNRLLESAASKSNAPRLARVLRAMEPVLLQLAAEDLDPADAEALLSQLAFELNVMLTKLATESSDDLLTT